MRKDVVEITEFISGKKYLSKQYLMSAYQPKKKKGKKVYVFYFIVFIFDLYLKTKVIIYSSI